MPTEMTLNLRLNGIQNLIQSIQALNRALNIVNTKFNVVSNNINNAANKINQAAQKLRSTGGVTPRRVGGGSGGGGNDLQDFDQQHLGSVLFSGFAGAWQIMGAKIFTRISTQLSQGLLKNHPLNPSGPGMQGATSNPIGSMATWKNFLSVLGQRILLVAAAFYLLFLAIKGLVSAITWAFSQIRSMNILSTAKGVPGGMEGAMRGLGTAFNMDPEKMAGFANREPGGARGFIQKIKALKNMVDQNPEGASYAAEHMGLSEFLPGLEQMSKQDLADALNTTSKSSITAKFWINEMNQELGKLKLTLSGLAELMNPVIVLGTLVIKFFRGLIEVFKFLQQTSIWGLIDQFGKWAKSGDKMNNAANTFDDAVNKFTDKVGTFGGGERGANPIPRAWTHYQYQRMLREQADNMGAFEF